MRMYVWSFSSIRGPMCSWEMLHFAYLTNFQKKKMTTAGLNSLWQKKYQISVKKWIFDDPLHKKGLVLVSWVLEMIKPSGSEIFLMNEAVEVIEAIEAAEVTEGIEAAGVFSGTHRTSYTRKTTKIHPHQRHFILSTLLWDTL